MCTLANTLLVPLGWLCWNGLCSALKILFFFSPFASMVSSLMKFPSWPNYAVIKMSRAAFMCLPVFSYLKSICNICRICKFPEIAATTVNFIVVVLTSVADFFMVYSDFYDSIFHVSLFMASCF